MEKNLFIDNQCIVNNYFRYLSFFLILLNNVLGKLLYLPSNFQGMGC